MATLPGVDMVLRGSHRRGQSRCPVGHGLGQRGCRGVSEEETHRWVPAEEADPSTARKLHGADPVCAGLGGAQMQPADVTPTCKPECGWGSWQKGGEGPVPGRRLREGSCEVFHPLPPALRTSCACWWRGEEGLPPGSPSHLPSGQPSLSSLPASACSDDARTGPSSRHDSPLTSVVIVGAVLPPSLPLAIPQRPSLPGSAALSGPQQVDGVGGRGGLKSPAPTSLQEKRHSLSIWGESGSPRGWRLWCPGDWAPPLPSCLLLSPALSSPRVPQCSPPCSAALQVLTENPSLQAPPVILTCTILLQVPSDKGQCQRL